MPQLFDAGIYSLVSQIGAPAVFKVAFYTTGTSTKLDTYPTSSDASAGTNANANPVLTDANGRLPAVWLKDQVYKAVLLTNADVVVKTVDPVNALNSLTLATLAATSGAALIGEASGVTVQSKLNTLTTGVANAASAAAAASATQNVLPSNPAALPYEVTAVSGGIGTGTGGTNGTYVGGVSGGPSGFQWTYTIAGGTLASYAITNPGLSIVNTAPTLSFPLGGLVAPTIPTATVGTIPVSRNFWAVTADSQYAALWTNAAGALTAVAGPDTNQVKEPLGNVLTGANKIAIKFAAGKAGKGSLLQRSTFQKGFYVAGSGAITASPNFVVVGPMPCSETQGIASTVGEFDTLRTLSMLDKDGNIVCSNLAAFTATFVAGSPNFTITAWRSAGPAFAPPGMPNVGGGGAATDPLMQGMTLKDVTNNNSTVIPAGAYADAVSPIPYSTSYTYTMKGPGGTALNALISTSINVLTGGFLPGVPIVPPMGFNVTQAYATMTYAGAFGYSQQIDDLDFFSSNVAIAAEQRNYTGSIASSYQRSSHDNGIGWADVEVQRSLLGRYVGAIGNSMLSHEAWSKAFTLRTRSKIVYRGAVAARQAHQFLDGASVGTILTNWNEQNPGNPNGAMVAADINGIEVLFIGTCGTNEQGYNNGAGVLDGTGGSGRLPYSIGAITENGAAVVASVTTTNGSATITVNSIVTQSALTPTLVGLVFPPTASFGLAGKAITAGPGTGAAGSYTINSGAGVTAGTGSMMIGSYYGTMNWMLQKLLAYNSTNVGKLLPVIIGPPRRYDLGSVNGGVTAGTFDLTHIGDPICASTGHRLSDFRTANAALGVFWDIPVMQPTGFSPFWEAAYYNQIDGGLHLNDGTLSGTTGFPIGDRALGCQMAALVETIVPFT